MTKIELTVNGKRLGLNSFVQTLFINIITGAVKSLKGVGRPREIIVKISEEN